MFVIVLGQSKVSGVWAKGSSKAEAVRRAVDKFHMMRGAGYTVLTWDHEPPAWSVSDWNGDVSYDGPEPRVEHVATGY